MDDSMRVIGKCMRVSVGQSGYELFWLVSGNHIGHLSLSPMAVISGRSLYWIFRSVEQRSDGLVSGCPGMVSILCFVAGVFFALCRPFCIFENVCIRTQRAAVASRCATNLATHLPPLSHLSPCKLATHLPPVSHTSPSKLATHLPPN